LRCLKCGWESVNDNYTLYCPTCGPDAFLTTVYENNDTAELSGDPAYFYSYQNLLPFHTSFEGDGPRIGCVKAENLGEDIGLKNLWLLLSCYAPEWGAKFITGTFKELEALGVYARVIEQTNKTLIISSAGNAGQAFLEIGVQNCIPAIILVPESALSRIYISAKPNKRMPLLIALRNAYYPDAIKMVYEIQNCFADRLVREGGCYNVARRDSIGILFHRAFREIGRIPDHYVQAVGSGTGAIAAWEAIKRINNQNTSIVSNMGLHLVQNTPFTPIVDAWNAKTKHIPPIDQDDLHKMLSQTYSKVLSNTTPPYSVVGGLYDALFSTGGRMYAVSNQEAICFGKLMIKHSGIIPDPEAAIALAGLYKALEQGKINQTDHVLLHITGGGWRRSVNDFKKIPYPLTQYVNRTSYHKIMDLVKQYLDHIVN
jgi:cysteate synthase